MTPTTSTTTQTNTTDRVKTRTSGTIHTNTAIEALQIVSGSTFPVENDALVQFEAGTENDAINFSVGVHQSTLNINTFTDTDVFIQGVLTGFNPDSTNQTPVKHVTYQVPYHSRHAFQDLQRTVEDATLEYHDGEQFNSWMVQDEYTDEIIARLLGKTETGDYDDVAVTMYMSTLRELFDAHPEHTVEDSGQYIITDNALVDPAHYDTESAEQGTGHGQGGNPHSITHYLEQGQCPVPSCDSGFDTFRELRGHVGGKCANNPDHDAHHDIALRLHEISVVHDTES